MSNKPGASPAGLLKDKAYKVALCVEGDQLSSEELAETIKKAALSGRSRLQFVIGDSDGLPAQVKEKCELRLSFSKMTFPHQLMRVILLEQLYPGPSISMREGNIINEKHCLSPALLWPPLRWPALAAFGYALGYFDLTFITR